MPAKSPTDLTTELGVLSERNDNTRREIEVIRKAIDGLQESMTSARSELTGKLFDQKTEATAVITDLRQELALVRQRLDDHLKRIELWSGRLWTLVVVLIGASFLSPRG